MANKLELAGSVLSMLIFTTIFFVDFISEFARVLAAMTAVFMLVAIFSADSKQSAKLPAAFSFAKFVVIIFPLTALMLSSGFLYAIIPIFNSSTTFQIQLLAFSLVFVESFIVFSMIHETSKKIVVPLNEAGYDLEELNREMGNFSKSISSIVLVSLFSSMIITLFLAFGPQLSLGIIPSLFLFVIVYVYVIYNYMNKTSSKDETE
ncbi:MAG: hypothetical protein M1414_06130 [Candidatus Thermoplasmatota archaeon]|nr:hypothetical protein [Candidatus Thermoplasmatota archaeon]